MTIRLDMLAAASRAKEALGDSSPLVVRFLLDQLNPDGGFRGRDSQSDLYYTMFGLEALLALDADVPSERLESYLTTGSDVESLDLIHLACWIRCHRDLSLTIPSDLRETVTQKLSAARSRDGGFNIVPNADGGTAYACFIALGLFQDMQLELTNTDGLLRCIASLKKDDGTYANELGLPVGSVPATAAAMAVLHYLNRPIESDSVDWLLAQFCATGGCRAVPAAPMPDLLSTATALHALALNRIPLDNLAEPTLDFIDTLWDGRGGFAGTQVDKRPDCEYTYYALLALGHLTAV